MSRKYWIIGVAAALFIILFDRFYLSREAKSPGPPPGYVEPLEPVDPHGPNMVPAPALQRSTVSSIFSLPEEETSEAVTALLKRARASLGYAELAARRQGFLLQGDTNAAEIGGGYSLLFTPRGHFLQEIDGPLSVAVGYDGKTGWALASASGPQAAEPEELLVPQIVTWVQTGRWLAPKGPFTITVPGSLRSDQPVVLALKMKVGGEEARISLDPTTCLPQSMVRTRPDGDETWQLRSYSRDLGVSFARQIGRSLAGVESLYHIRRVSTAPKMVGNPYGPMSLRLAHLRDRGAIMRSPLEA